MWVRRGRGRGPEGVSFNKESFGGFCEVRYNVRDVTLGDVVFVFCGGFQDLGSRISGFLGDNLQNY